MRGLSVRVVSGLCAASWLVLPGFGVVDLSVTWNAAWPQALEAGWGLFATVIVGAAFLLVAVHPRGSTAGVAQLVIATLALAISAAVSKEGSLFLLVAFLALQTALVAALLRAALGRAGFWNPRSATRSPSLLLLAWAGVIPWFAYALRMWGLNREERSDSDVTIGVDHYSVQGALALSLALLPLFAAMRDDARPFVPLCACVAAFYLGLVSLGWPSSSGGLGRAWSAAAIAWALALLAATLVPRLRPVPLEP